MAETATKTKYRQRLDRERAEGVREGKLSARESRVSERERSSSRPSRSGSSVPVRAVATAPAKARRSPYLALTFATMLIVWVQLGRNGKLQKNQKIAAGVASIIVLLTIALLGEVSPEIATGFATLLFLSVLLGGTDAVAYIFETIPHNLINGAA